MNNDFTKNIVIPVIIFSLIALSALGFRLSKVRSARIAHKQEINK